ITQKSQQFQKAKINHDGQRDQNRQLPQTKVEVQDSNLEKIARFAVKAASVNRTGLLVVEDSGLFIEALKGFPGPFSSYVYKTIGLNGILSLMHDQRKRNAYFQTSIAVASINVSA